MKGVETAVPGGPQKIGYDGGNWARVGNRRIVVQQALVILFFFLSLVVPEFSQEHSLKIGLGVLYVHDLVFLILLLMNLRKIVSFISRRQSVYLRIVYAFVVLIACGSLLGVLYGNSATLVLRETRFLGYSLFFFVTLAIFQNQTDRFVKISLFIGFMVAMRGLYEQIMNAPVIENQFSLWGEQLQEVATLSGEKSRSFTSAVLIFASVYAFSKVSTEKKYLYLGLLMLFVLCVVLSFARNLYLGLILSFLSFLIVGKHGVSRGGIVLIAILGFFYMLGRWLGVDLLYDVWTRLGLSMVVFDSSVYSRLVELDEGIKAFEASPLLGHGLGYVLVNPFLPSEFQGITGIHNTYLYFLVNTGLVGITVFIALLALYMRLALKESRRDTLSAVIFATLIGVSITLVFAHRLSGEFFSAWFFSLLALQYLVSKGSDSKRNGRGAVANA